MLRYAQHDMRHSVPFAVVPENNISVRFCVLLWQNLVVVLGRAVTGHGSRITGHDGTIEKIRFPYSLGKRKVS